MTFVCECCQHECDFCSWTRARWTKPTVWLCPYCRASYSVTKGVCTLIRGAQLPLESAATRQGVWELPEKNPIYGGHFEVRLRSNEPDVTVLLYDGISFVDADNEPIYPSAIIGWRGKWPE